MWLEIGASDSDHTVSDRSVLVDNIVFCNVDAIDLERVSVVNDFADISRHRAACK